MDKNVLSDLQEISKALKAAIVRSQNGITALASLAKLGPHAMDSSAPNILTELRQLEGEMQRFLKSYREHINKAVVSTSTAPEREAQQ